MYQILDGGVAPCCTHQQSSIQAVSVSSSGFEETKNYCVLLYIHELKIFIGHKTTNTHQMIEDERSPLVSSLGCTDRGKPPTTTEWTNDSTFVRGLRFFVVGEELFVGNGMTGRVRTNQASHHPFCFARTKGKSDRRFNLWSQMQYHTFLPFAKFFSCRLRTTSISITVELYLVLIPTRHERYANGSVLLAFFCFWWNNRSPATSV